MDDDKFRSYRDRDPVAREAPEQSSRGVRTKLMFMGDSPVCYQRKSRATSIGQVASTTSPTFNGLQKNFRSDT